MKRLVLLGLLVFVAIMVATFPARVAYDWFAPPDLELRGIAGSVWNGSAAEGVAGGAYVRDITWRFLPSSLLDGELGFATTSSPLSGTIETNVRVDTGGALTLSALAGQVPLDMVHPAFQQAGLSGDIELDFDTLTIENGLPVAAIGSVTVSNFYAPDLVRAPVGDFRADFETVDGTIAATVTSLSGMLDVDGTVSINPDRSYSFDGLVSATAQAPQALRNQLNFLGSPDDAGRHFFRFEGQL